VTETIAAILKAHRSGATTPHATLARSFARIRAHADPAVFITLRDEAEALAEARALTAEGPRGRPLYGVPVAVKDNIDVAGLPTTAACPAFAYTPAHDATVVARLRAAGAIVIGKTNLDQFATGLVGLRSPYGTPRNTLRADLVPGGSSSGSAVAVAAGLVPLALGTDTAGSGRVPAGLNNIVGLKPSLGLLPATGMVPACRTLDCVSIFALTVDDAHAALAVMAGPDGLDALARALPLDPLGAAPRSLTIAVPRARDRLFCGDRQFAAAFSQALERLAGLGAALVEIDLSPFLETARLLYHGPWLAERYAAVGAFLASHADALHPVTKAIIEAGADISAADAFHAFYRLAELRRAAQEQLAGTVALAVPTAPTAYTLAEVEAEPVKRNSDLGTYTNFVNLLDLAALAVPAAILPDGTPFGITLIAAAGRDGQLAGIGRAFHAATKLPLGALAQPQPDLPPLDAGPGADEVALAVVGAHLSGMALNGELNGLGARFLAEAVTSPDYRLFALAGTVPAKPGLLRVPAGTGLSIVVESWALSTAAFGRFVAAVPPPLCIGTLVLGDGSKVKGFLVEAEAVKSARDISHHGGWRAYVAASARGPAERETVEG
jgi:allophanate hydrolase